jgi:hypothetical protein
VGLLPRLVVDETTPAGERSPVSMLTSEDVLDLGSARVVPTRPITARPASRDGIPKVPVDGGSHGAVAPPR